MVAVAVVDDDAEARACLQQYLQRFAGEQQIDITITAFASAVDLLRHYRPVYDLIFLDIEMAQVDGIRAAHTIRETDPSTILIFVTNMAQLAIRGYEVEALDFVVKPVDYPSFAMVMHRAMRHMSMRRRHTVRIATRGGLRVVPLDHIDYVEVRDHYLTYHTTDGEFTVKGTLAQAEAALTAGRFMRCNRWYVVNIDKVTGVADNMITVGGQSIEVSRTRKQEILQAVAASMGGGL